MTPLCWLGESIMVTGPVNLCSPIPLACGPNPTDKVLEHLVSFEKSIFFSFFLSLREIILSGLDLTR